MKIKNHKTYEWVFIPSKNSKLEFKRYTFKYKADLMKFLNKNIKNSINGIVKMEVQNFDSSGTQREWFVWYNDYRSKNEPLKIVLKQLTFRGRKYVYKFPISKENKKWCAFTNKISERMYAVENEDGSINENVARNLIALFKKRGLKDEPMSEELKEYVEHNLADSDSPPFHYWSDRCDLWRSRVILEYFKKLGIQGI